MIGGNSGNIPVQVLLAASNQSVSLGDQVTFKSSDSTLNFDESVTFLGDQIGLSTFPKLAMRIQVVNGISKRSKDLIVDVTSENNLYDSVYDNKAVKDAHVRKWPSHIGQKVKNNTNEIQCSVWDDVVDMPCHSFSLDELKRMSTKQLYELVPEIDPVKLVLQCIPKRPVGESSSAPFPFPISSGGRSADPIKRVNVLTRKQSESQGSSKEALSQAEAVATSSVEAMACSSSKPLVQTCPVSGGSGIEQSHPPLSRQSSQVGECSTVTVSSAVLPISSPAPTCPFTGVQMDPAMWQSFKDKMKGSRDSFSSRVSHNNLSSPSGEEKFEEECVDNKPKMFAPFKPVAIVQRTSSISTSTVSAKENSPGVSVVDGTIMSDSTLGLVQEGSGCDDSPTMDLFVQKTNLRVRIINKMTNRSKDLVVEINSETNLFDSVYDNKGVKDAHVRKWGSKIAQEVKNKVSEIRLAVWDDDANEPWRIFSVDELKETSTRQLYEIVAENCDLVKLHLMCVKRETALEKTIPNSSENDRQQREPLSATEPKSLVAIAVSLGRKPEKRRGYDLSQKSMSQGPYSSLASVDENPGSLTTGSSIYNSFGSFSSLEQLLSKSSFRIRVINDSTQRSKDLVVEINDDLMLYDFIENNQEVKDVLANKWEREGAEQAKTRVIIWDSTSDQQLRDFSIDELKQVTTRHLHSMVSESSDLIKIIFKCVTNIEKVDSKPGVTFDDVRRPSSKKTLRHSQSEAVLKHSTTMASMAKPSRPNHMKISSASSNSLSSLGKSPRSKSSLRGKGSSLSSSVHGSTRKRAKTDIDKLLMVSMNSRRVNEAKANTVWQGGESSQKQTLPTALPIFQRHIAVESQRKLDLGHTAFRERRRSSTNSVVCSKSITESRLNDDGTLEKIKDFKKLVRGKKPVELQSERDRSCVLKTKTSPPSVVEAEVAKETTLTTRISSLTFHEKRPNAMGSSGGPNATFPAVIAPNDLKSNAFLSPNMSQSLLSPGLHSKSGNADKKISRFLRLQRPDTVLLPPMEVRSGRATSIGSRTESDEASGSCSCRCTQSELDHYLQSETAKSITKSSVASNEKCKPPSEPEISVLACKGATTSSTACQGISLSPDLVKEVFPYHVVVDSDFRILQVGNSLSSLIEGSLLGRVVSDVMMVLSPIPMFGKWDWSILEKMKEKTIFLETVLSDESCKKSKIKGTVIEISKSPKQIMLALFPNVKNLTELDEMNLSMADLPLHSCQREAVLLGEHSRSEVKLTNHLDKLHRDLIDSMEQQIKDRTEELAAANRELERANAQLAIQSARQLEHFACMSHEIRTPLNCIVGMSSLLLDDADDMDPMHSDSIRMINGSGELLKAVVDDVLDYAKLESGSFEVDIKMSNLQHALDNVVHSISQKTQVNGIRLRTDYSPFLPEMVETDSRRLQQVLYNLLGNAVKFSKDNSFIDLTVSLVPVAMTGVKAEDTSNGEVIRFSVKDYGKGIEKKDFKKIFEPFSQASKETQTVYGGTGLGLSITSKLVYRLGGTISLNSEFGKFAEFTVDLPFRGIPVDISKVKRRLANVVIVLVEPEIEHNHSFTETNVTEEPLLFREAVVVAFNLTLLRFNTLETFLDKLGEQRVASRNRRFAILLHEKLFRSGTLERLESRLDASDYTLMTFGPNYLVPETRNVHFKSLESCFPSSLLESVLTRMEQQKREIVPPSQCLKRNQEPIVSTADGNGKQEEHGKLQVSNEGHNQSNAPRGLFAALDLSMKSDSALPMESKTQQGAGLFGPLSMAASSDKAAPREVATPLSQASRGLSLSQPDRPPELALNSEARAQPIRKMEKSPSRDLKLKVLYAEDNVVNQKIMSRVLTRAGVHDITIVDNGKKAVEICETVKFDCILMDMQMPVMGGMEATKLILERDKDAKVAFVTAHALEEYKMQALEVGAIGFIAKPFRKEDLEALLLTLSKHSEQPNLGITSSTAPQPVTAEPPSEKHDRKTIGIPATERKIKVLYAEDNVVNQKVLSKILARAGVEDVTIVDNGKKAVELSERTQFDCIFMDMEMPVMGGMEACKLITTRDKDAKVVFVTAHALDEVKAQAETVGSVGFISKPFRLSDIQNLLAKLSL